jgi:CheY-like chemotaxis protein
MAKKILVVDDEADIVEMIISRLNIAGYETDFAYSGQTALTKAQEVKPDLILLDIILPDIDGGTVAQKLKTISETKNIPVVFLTCIVKQSELKGSQGKIGDNVFIAKPFKPEVLLKVVKEHIG